MQVINNIVVHCSDSIFGNVNHIRKWHLERKWRDIGYHFVVLNGFLYPDFYLSSMVGSIECGRILNGDNVIDDNEKGAHALGYNHDSIGVCLIGKTQFPIKQLKSAIIFVADLVDFFKIETQNIKGHCETKYSRAKSCPNLDMDWFRQQVGIELE